MGRAPARSDVEPQRKVEANYLESAAAAKGLECTNRF